MQKLLFVCYLAQKLTGQLVILYLTLETNALVIHDDKFESLGLMQNFGLDLDSVISQRFQPLSGVTHTKTMVVQCQLSDDILVDDFSSYI